MRFPKLLPIAFLLMVPSVLAQLAGVSSVGRAMGGVFGSIFDGISNNPAVWMKVILIIILYIIFYVVVLPRTFSAHSRHKGGRNILALVLAIAMVAPIPSSIIVTLFVSLAFMGLVFYVAPVIGIMYLTHKMTKKDDKTGVEPGRTPFAVALILWLLTLFAYINGLGFAAGVDIPNLELTAGILNFVAVIAIIYYAIRLLTVSGVASVAEGYTDWFNRGGTSKTPPSMPPGKNPPNVPEDPEEDAGGKKGKGKTEIPKNGGYDEKALDTAHEYAFWKPWTWKKSKTLKQTLGMVDDSLSRLSVALEDLQVILSRGKDNEKNVAVKHNPNVQVLLNDVTAATAILSRVDVVRKDSTLKQLLSQMERTASDLSSSIDKGMNDDWTLLLYRYFGRGGIAVTVYNRIAALFKKDLKQTQDELVAQQILLKREEDRARQAEAAKSDRSAQLKAVRSVAYKLWRTGGLNPFTWHWNQPQQRNVDELMSSLMAVAAEVKPNPQAVVTDGRLISMLGAIAKSGIAGPWLVACNQRLREVMKVREVVERGGSVEPIILERIRVRIYQFAEAWVRRSERVA